MKIHSFSSRLQELNAYLAEFCPDTEGQKIKPFATDEIMDIIDYSMFTTWKNRLKF